MLQLSGDAYVAMLAHTYDELPMEACGLVIGSADGDVATIDEFRPSANLAASARVYELDPRVLLRADRDADERGLAVLGVMHSHTHTAPYPSPTDVAQAPDPTWHYVIVSLADGSPSLRSYRIVDGNISEEPVVVAAAHPTGASDVRSP